MSGAVVLLSGGLDSAVCLTVAIERHGAAGVYALSVNYGQTHGAAEMPRARLLAEKLGARHEVATVGAWSIRESRLCGGHWSPESAQDSPDYVPGRNAVLLALALSLAERTGSSEIYIGANADDRAAFPDCRPDAVLGFGSALGVRVVAPLMGMTKPQIQALAIAAGVRAGDVWSCYRPTGSPGSEAECGECGACTAGGPVKWS